MHARLADRIHSITPGRSLRISHSQIRIGTYPSRSAIFDADSSRTLFTAIFSRQSSTLGPLVTGRTWAWPCQKQPSTQIASPWRGRTRSGLQAGARRTYRRKRKPARCSARRSRSSGRVFLVGRPERCLPASVGMKCRLASLMRVHCALAEE